MNQKKNQKQKTFNLITPEDLNYKVEFHIKKKIKDILLRNIYLNFKEFLEDEKLINKTKNLTNSVGFPSLSKDILEGKLYFHQGYLKGNFSLQNKEEIERLGGVWNREEKGYLINRELIPQYLKNIIQNKEEKKSNLITFLSTGFATALLNINKETEETNFAKIYSFAFNEVEKRFIENDINKTKDIINSKEYIEKYTENLKYSIKNFADKETLNLRKEVLENIQKGISKNDLKKILNKHYNLNLNRSEFIANQETRLALANYQYDKMEKEGNYLFFWVHTDPNGETSRPEHIEFFKESNAGKIFDYRNLPLDAKTGLRDAPGLKINCRCIARFLV